MVAHPFAQLTSDIFSKISPELGKLGYNIGRFIYIADAYNDIEDDKKHKLYNPFIYYDNDYLNSMEFTKRVQGTFNMNLGAVAESYASLNIKKNKALLDNIIYLGLGRVCNKFFNTNGGNNDRSL